MNKDVMVVNESSDKSDCFAWISKNKCNALSCKNCNGCSFYKHFSKVSNYSKYISKKDLVERKKNR